MFFADLPDTISSETARRRAGRIPGLVACEPLEGGRLMLVMDNGHLPLEEEAILLSEREMREIRRLAAGNGIVSDRSRLLLETLGPLREIRM